MSDLPSRDDLLKVMGLIGGHGESANILHTTAEHLRANLPAASPAFVLDVALGLLDILDRECAENAAMRPIVEGVVPYFETKGQCGYCMAIPWRNEDHTDDCIYALARALLAKEAQG